MRDIFSELVQFIVFFVLKTESRCVIQEVLLSWPIVSRIFQHSSHLLWALYGNSLSWCAVLKICLGRQCLFGSFCSFSNGCFVLVGLNSCLDWLTFLQVIQLVSCFSFIIGKARRDFWHLLTKADFSTFHRGPISEIRQSAFRVGDAAEGRLLFCFSWHEWSYWPSLDIFWPKFFTRPMLWLY